MFTRCPHCETCFRITPEQLKAARGEVRCGRCFGTFNSLEHLVEEIEEQDSPEIETVSSDSIAPPSESSTEPEWQLVNDIQADARVATTPQHFFLWLLLAMVLTAVLTGQYAYFNLQPLAQQAQLRPALTLLCDIAACEVPLLRAPELIKLVDRDIHVHPSLSDTLRVKGEMINNADFTQAFPLLELSLQDITGHTLARRQFTPHEYLSSTVDTSQGLTPNQPVQILLELVDPGEAAVGFEFEFL